MFNIWKQKNPNQKIYLRQYFYQHRLNKSTYSKNFFFAILTLIVLDNPLTRAAHMYRELVIPQSKTSQFISRTSREVRSFSLFLSLSISLSLFLSFFLAVSFLSGLTKHLHAGERWVIDEKLFITNFISPSDRLLSSWARFVPNWRLGPFEASGPEKFGFLNAL